MASGSAVTITGGTNMTQVVAGTDTIAAADFNNARTNVNTLLSGAADVTTGTFTVANTYGWNQGGAGVSAASAGNTSTSVPTTVTIDNASTVCFIFSDCIFNNSR